MKLLRLYRTLQHLQRRQAWAQLSHALGPRLRPVRLRGDPPGWAVARAHAPFLGAPAHARWNGAGRIEMVGRGVDFGTPGNIDWQHDDAGALWAYQLHFFEWARCEGASNEARRAVLVHWLDACDTRDRGAPISPAWDPHPLSVRTLSWLKLCLDPDGPAGPAGPGEFGRPARGVRLDEALDARLRASLADQVETLSRNLEHRLQANHLLDNLIAVVAGAIALEGPRRGAWLRRTRLLLRELDEQIDEDGAHCERSPMYHSILLEHLLDLLNLGRAAAGRAPEGLVETLAETCGRMLGALRVWTHPDGRIGLFGDSAFGLAAEPAALEAYAASLGVVATEPAARGVLRTAGFARLESRELTLIASLVGPNPPQQPGHAHCDALSFELSAGRQRIVCDTGVYEYAPGERRDRARSTRAHATVVVDSEEQAELWASHRIGGRPRTRLTSAAPERWAEGICAGWRTLDTLHRRQFLVVPSGLEIADRIERRRRPVRFALPLAPGIEPSSEELRAGVLRIPLAEPPIGPALGRVLEWTLPEGIPWREERGPYYPGFGREEERVILVGEAARFTRSRMRLRVVR